jgi:hypothetical protein
VIAALISYLFRCTHANVTWPICNRQACLDCGKTRHARMTSTGWAFTRWTNNAAR